MTAIQSDIFIGAGIFVCAGLLLLGFLLLKANTKHQKELLRLAQYTTNVQATIDRTIPSVLEYIIEDCFKDYQIMVLFPRSEIDIYLTDEREKEIRDDLVDMVANRISSAALDKLSLFYQVQNIDKIIADKVYITVMNYCVEHNALIEGNVEATRDKAAVSPASI